MQSSITATQPLSLPHVPIPCRGTEKIPENLRCAALKPGRRPCQPWTINEH